MNVKTEKENVGWFWHLTYAIGLDIMILGVFVTVLAVLMVVFGGKFTFVQSSIILPLIFMSGLIVIGFATRIKGIMSNEPGRRMEFIKLSLGYVRDWFPLVLIVFVYENFHDLTDLIRPTVVDATLQNIDIAIFGVEPTIWLQRFVTPWLTEYMTFAYALYFLYPAAFLGILYSSGEFIKFRELGLALSLCFYLGLTGYMTVPAIGPRYFMPEAFTVPLDGIWLTAKAAAAWSNLTSIKRDCFPSLHTALTTISLIYLWRYRKVWRGGRIMLFTLTPLIVSLWMSTIYLRYHWTIDVLAGWVLAVFCTYAAPWFIRWYYGRKLGTAPEVSLDVARRS